MSSADRHAACTAQGQGTSGGVRLPGLHALLRQDRNERFLLCQKTQRQRMIRKLKELRREMRRRMHQRLRDQHAWLSSVQRGHYAYFGISSNSRALGRFRLQVMKAWRRVLLRRSQRPKLSWERFNALLKVFPLPFGRVHGWRQQMA